MADGAAPNKSALLLAIGGKPKGPAAAMGETDEPMEDEGADMAGAKAMAAGDVMAAFKSGDAVALETALTDFVLACKSEDY
jgi:hypothetical protein